MAQRLLSERTVTLLLEHLDDAIDDVIEHPNKDEEPREVLGELFAARAELARIQSRKSAARKPRAKKAAVVPIEVAQ